ncbi:MAG: hypothetical protein HDR19_07710 [Lachnospiraceae bacterium]|nr:hypothetical protein [Lachnospiraceae bacterium]
MSHKAKALWETAFPKRPFRFYVQGRIRKSAALLHASRTAGRRSKLPYLIQTFRERTDLGYYEKMKQRKG